MKAPVVKKTAPPQEGCLGTLGCLGAVVTGPSKGGLFSGGGGLFRGLFRAGRWRVHHRHKNRQAGWWQVGRWAVREDHFFLSLIYLLLSSSFFFAPRTPTREGPKRCGGPDVQ